MLSGNVRFIEGALFWPNRRAFGMNSDVFDKKKCHCVVEFDCSVIFCNKIM